MEIDTRDYRAAMVKWAEQTHRETREIRVMVQVFFAVWLIGLIGAVLVFAVVAANDWF